MRLGTLPLMVLVTGIGCGSVTSPTPEPHPSEPTTASSADEPDVLFLEYQPGGTPLSDLLARFDEQSDFSILYDPTSRVRDVRIEFVGDFRIPRDRALKWLEAVLAYHGMLMTQVRGTDGSDHWFVFERT